MAELQNLSCGCGNFGNARVDSVYFDMTQADAPLAMAYVPYQQWETPYDLCKGLHAGTLFRGLHKPFCGKGGKRW